MQHTVLTLFYTTFNFYDDFLHGFLQKIPIYIKE